MNRRGYIQTTRITKEPAERRQEILDIAIQLFYENGYEKTSMADIASTINVAQGLCYRYFPSKEVLLDEAIDSYARVLAEGVTSLLEDENKSLKEIISQMPELMQTVMEAAPYHKSYYSEQSQKIHGRVSMKVCEMLVPTMTRKLDAANTRGECSITDSGTAAIFCLYGQQGVLGCAELSSSEKVIQIRELLGRTLKL